MSFLKKSVSFIAVFSVLPAAYALTARPSVLGNASARMPTMTAYVTSSGTTVSGSSSSSSSSGTISNSECVESYTACMKGDDACGGNFEECTNKVLFHGKMSQCLSTLSQCSSTAINSLFGTGSITSLSNVASKNSYGEVTDYTYPTDGSMLGQMITSAAIANKYDTSTCVKRYTSCLKKDSVCGTDFELCTTDKEFRKQRVFCDSTLARCQSDGLMELFGSVSTSGTPTATSRVGELISEGAATAAVNAVATCYKVVDQCILNACATNPYKCSEGASSELRDLAESIINGTENNSASNVSTIADSIAKSAISGYIKSACLDTIGSNKYCYATFIGNGQMPTGSQLKDEDNQEEIFDEAYASRMNNAMKSKITDLVNKFDTKAKQKCTDTIRTCAMRVCGEGSGAACYAAVFGAKGQNTINGAATRDGIKTGCSAVVNTDTNCKYAAANVGTSGTYSYTYINSDAFDTLFPVYEEGVADPIGVVASLNASLSNNYSTAALAQMKKQCQSVATSCVKSMCGADYVNCYRNRTDVYSSLTNTGESSFDKSMNKVGGVLDYTIVLGLCLDVVKNASVCEEHLAIERSKVSIGKMTGSAWNTDSVRGDWIDAGGATDMVVTDGVKKTDDNGNQICTNASGIEGICYNTESDGSVYDKPVYISVDAYKQSQAASSLFRDLIYDIEKEAQAKYNAKLTKEQNMCLASNSGGVLGNKDTGSAYMWVKLKSAKVPTNYATAGLKSTQFAASNDIYGSFCRARVTLQSDDKKIQDVISKGADWSTAYFAVGDAFTCGSWIPESALDKLANAVADDATKDKKESQDRTRNWLTALGAVGGAVGGGFLGDGIQKGSILGSVTGIENKSKKEDYFKNCSNYASQAAKQTTLDSMQSFATSAIGAANGGLKELKSSQISATDNKYGTVKDKTEKLLNALNSAGVAEYNTTDGIAAVTKESQQATILANYKTQLAGICTSYENVTILNGKAKEAQTYTMMCPSVNGTAVISYALVSAWQVTANAESATTGECKPNQEGGKCRFAQAAKTILDAAVTEYAAATGTAGTAATQTVKTTAEQEKMGRVRLAASELSTACAAADLEQATSANDGKKNNQWIGAAAGSVIGGVAGGFLLNRATADIQKSRLDAAKKAAYEEWMSQIGQHIRCFIGGDEVGVYGDMISLSIE